MKTIGLLTSGGDAPGMNAAVRAVVRSASVSGINVKASSRGYQGLIDHDIRELDTHTVSDIIQRGGNPTARDRVLSSRLGHAAVKTALEGHTKVMVGVVNNKIKLTPLRMAWSKKKDIDYEVVELAKILR